MSREYILALIVTGIGAFVASMRSGAIEKYR